MNIAAIGKSTSSQTFAVLDALHAQSKITHVVSSGRPDASTYAIRWALLRGVPRVLVPNDDKKLLKEKVDLIICFDPDERDAKLIEDAKNYKTACFKVPT